MKIRFFLVALFAALLVKAGPPAEEGKTIFTARCAGCHNVNKVITGPALAGVEERRSIDWIISFVHSSQTVIKSGDKDAIALFEKFNKIPMPDHSDLTADHIKSIVEYIKVEAKSGGVEKPPFAKPKKLHPNYVPVSITNYSYFIGYLGLIGLLIAAMLLAVKVKSIQRNKHTKDE
jgi:cytochrome c551/c552